MIKNETKKLIFLFSFSIIKLWIIPIKIGKIKIIFWFFIISWLKIEIIVIKTKIRAENILFLFTFLFFKFIIWKKIIKIKIEKNLNSFIKLSKIELILNKSVLSDPIDKGNKMYCVKKSLIPILLINKKNMKAKIIKEE